LLNPIISEYNLKATANDYNTGTRSVHMKNEIMHSFINFERIHLEFRYGFARDLNDIPKSQEPCIALGSGPTLDEDAWKLLRKWKHPIICSTSQAPTAIYHGVDPRIIVCLDAATNLSEFRVDKWEGRDITLALHPGIRPDIVNFWTFNKKAYFRKQEPAVDFYANEQFIAFPFISTQVVMMACVLPAQIFIGALMGWGPFFLVGADMSYPNDISRFDEWFWNGKEWEMKPQPEQNLGQLIMTREGVKADIVMAFYKRNMMSAWRLGKDQIINTSHAGILREFPLCPLEEVVRKQGKDIKGFTIPERIEAADRAMAIQNTYALEYSNGLRFVETFEPMKDLPSFFDYVKAQGVKDVDVEGNLKRVEKLHAYSVAEKEKFMAAYPEFNQADLVPKEDLSRGVEFELKQKDPGMANGTLINDPVVEET